MAVPVRVRSTLAAGVPIADFVARFVQLNVGLATYGVGLALMVRAGLGLAPWDVFHQGLARQTHMAIGTWVVIVGLAVLLLWIPLRLRPGIGAICNALFIGATMNAALAVVSAPHAMPVRVVFLIAGVLLCGLATGLYIGPGLGPGPRDGLMVGIAARGQSIRVVRTGLELTVLVAGVALGGTLGVGTLLYAMSIGPMAHVTIPWFRRAPAA